MSLYLVSVLALTASDYNFFRPPLRGIWYWGSDVVVRPISPLDGCACPGGLAKLLSMSSALTLISSLASWFVFVVCSSTLFVRLTKMLLRVNTHYDVLPQVLSQVAAVLRDTE